LGPEDRLDKLEQSFGSEPGPPPQEYYEARARRGRYVRGMLALGLEGELAEEERTFMEEYRDSPLKEDDGRLIERHAPPRSEERAAEVRARMRESLDEIAEKRRARGI
jgi:hypothetical protein